MVSVNRSVPRLRAFLFAGLVVAGLGAGGQPLWAQATPCTFVKAADVALLLGETPIATPPGNSCAWKVAGSKRRLLVLTYSNRMPGEMLYNGAHQSAEKEPESKFMDEAGIGDKAFSMTVPFGAMFMMMKGGRVLQLQFHTYAQGTEKDRDALRLVARKAIAAF